MYVCWGDVLSSTCICLPCAGSEEDIVNGYPGWVWLVVHGLRPVIATIDEKAMRFLRGLCCTILTENQLKMRPFWLVLGCRCVPLLVSCASPSDDLDAGGGTANLKCSRRLVNEEPFDRFFSEVFRHHAGQQMLGGGERETRYFRHNAKNSSCKAFLLPVWCSLTRDSARHAAVLVATLDRFPSRHIRVSATIYVLHLTRLAVV